MSADQNAAASGRHCRCGHNQAKHLDVLSGECVTCSCRAFRPVERVTVPHRTPVTLPAGERHLVAASWIDGLVAEVDTRHGITGHRRRQP